MSSIIIYDPIFDIVQSEWVYIVNGVIASVLIKICLNREGFSDTIHIPIHIHIPTCKPYGVFSGKPSCPWVIVSIPQIIEAGFYIIFPSCKCIGLDEEG